MEVYGKSVNYLYIENPNIPLPFATQEHSNDCYQKKKHKKGNI